MNILNYTPHTVCLNDGRSFPSVGIARVQSSFTDFDDNGICQQTFGDIVGLPTRLELGISCGDCAFCEAEINGNCSNFHIPADTLIIVSAMVLAANRASGNPIEYLVVPATGHPDTIRDDNGHIVSVPGWVQ